MTLPTRQKIGLFCNVPTERVLSLYDVPTIYRVPLEMLERSTPHGAPTEPRASHRLATEGSHPGLAGRLPGRQVGLVLLPCYSHAWAAPRADLDILISEQLGLTSYRGPPPSAADEVVLGGAESALATARLAAGATSGAPLRLRRDERFAEAWAAMEPYP